MCGRESNPLATVCRTSVPRAQGNITVLLRRTGKNHKTGFPGDQSGEYIHKLKKPLRGITPGENPPRESDPRMPPGTGSPVFPGCEL